MFTIVYHCLVHRHQPTIWPYNLLIDFTYLQQLPNNTFDILFDSFDFLLNRIKPETFFRLNKKDLPFIYNKNRSYFHSCFKFYIMIKIKNS